MKIAFKNAASSSTLPTTSEMFRNCEKPSVTKRLQSNCVREIQQVQDHVTYLVTFCGLELSATNLPPNILHLLQHGQQLLSKAEEEVIINNFSVLIYPTS